MTLALGCIIQGVLKARPIWLVGLLCAGAPALFQQVRPTAADPVWDNEVRAIYSWLITHSPGRTNSI